jgi:hypothetical protein
MRANDNLNHYRLYADNFLKVQSEINVDNPKQYLPLYNKYLQYMADNSHLEEYLTLKQRLNEL